MKSNHDKRESLNFRDIFVKNTTYNEECASTKSSRRNSFTMVDPLRNITGLFRMPHRDSGQFDKLVD